MSDVSTEMPKYRSHKHVWALKIAAIEILEDGSAKIAPVEKGYAVFTEPDYTSKFESGDDPGYYVVYADGYKSWSPTKAFEAGYTRI